MYFSLLLMNTWQDFSQDQCLTRLARGENVAFLPALTLLCSLHSCNPALLSLRSNNTQGNARLCQQRHLNSVPRAGIHSCAKASKSDDLCASVSSCVK